MNLVQYFLAFMLYSIIGWAYETALYTVQEGRYISSGFLKGPYCPIYGGGAVAMVFCFYGRTDNSWMIFFGGMAIATVIEYLVAVILENCFHKKWWDYSNIRFNFQGRICLLGALCFGTLCMLLCKAVHPAFMKMISIIPENYQFWSAVVLAIIFVCDYIYTIAMLHKTKKTQSKNRDDYENKLPQLNTQELFSNLGNKINSKIKIKDRIHFGGISYIIEKLKLKPFYIEKVEPLYTPIKEKFKEFREK